MTLEFERPERLCIVDNNGSIVRLNDRQRTELRFDASQRQRARRILDELNAYHAQCLTVGGRGPYRMLPLIGENPIDHSKMLPCGARYYVMVFRGGLVYDRQWHDADGFSVDTFIREMLSHGYGLDIRFMEFTDEN